MGQPTTLEQRLRIAELSQTGHTDAQIAALVGCALPTVRKWRRRAQREGRTALASHMGRPVGGSLSTVVPLIRETLRTWRTTHPGWGPKTLRAKLLADERFAERDIPSQRSIARFLAATQLSRPYTRHTPLPTEAVARAEAPHTVWEMDAKGADRVPDVGRIALIDINDRYSRVRLLSYPAWLGRARVERYLNAQDYQLALRLAFTHWGLPDTLAVDRDGVFYDNTTPSPFPTLFHLWLVALAVTLHLGPPARPTERGMTERSHERWAQHVLRGQHFDDWWSLYLALRREQDFLNRQLPCASLDNQPPLVAHPQTAVPRRLYRPEHEATLLDMSRVYAYLAQGRWFRRVSTAGTVRLGHQRYWLGYEWVRQQIEITFDPTDQCLVCRAADGETIKRLPLQGVSAETLMGDLTAVLALPAFQFALPFTWHDWQVIQLCGTLLL